MAWPIWSSRQRARPIRPWTSRSIRAGGISTSTVSTTGPNSTGDGVASARRARARGLRSRHRQRAARRRRRAGLALSRSRQRRRRRALGGLGACEPSMMFRAGACSRPVAEPRCGSMRRPSASFDRSDARRGFQVSDDNPLTGIDGRADLLRRLGGRRRGAPEIFGATIRRGRAACSIISRAGVERRASRRRPSSRELLEHLGPIWPSRLTLGGVPLGDCWRHPAIVTGDATSGLVPLHKLSQWLAYSLIEPLQGRRHRGHRHRRPHRPCRISQRRAVRRYRRAGAARPAGDAAARTTSPRRWSSSGARSPSRCSTGSRRCVAPAARA